MTRKLLKSFSLMLFMLHGSSEVFAHTHSMGAGLNETRSSELTVASNENGFIADGNYYIRNAEAGTFFAGGNAWGTRLSLKSAGDLIQITKKSGSDGYIMKDMSLINASTGAQIGEPNGALTIFIDQTSPASGYKFHKLTMDEIKVINDKNSTSFYKDDKGEYVDVSKSDKAYYLISYVNRNNQTVYLAEGSTAESGHHEVDGKYYDGNIPTLASAVWEIFTRDQLVSDLYNNATEEYFMSATPFITNPDFSRNYNARGNVNDNGWNVVYPISDIYGENENFVAKAENIEFELNQTLTNIPNGKYGITANGVYEGVEAATGNPYLYVTAGDKTYKKEFKYSEGTTSIQDWSSKFPSDKSYMLDTIYVTIWNNTLTIGFKGDRTDVTSYFDNVQLLYFGKTTNLSTLNTKLNALKKSASTIKKINKPMSAECKAAIEAALQLYPDDEDANELNDAIAQVSKAIDDANASIALYGELTEKYLDVVKFLSAEAQEWYDKNITVAIVNAGKLVSEDQLKAGLKTARIINGKGGDVTEFTIVNPSFETGSTTGWTVDGILGSDTGVKNVESSPRYAMDPMDGVCLYNTWNQGSGTTIHQSLKGLPYGRYVLSALMASTNIEGDVRYLHLSAGNHTVSVPAVSDNESRKVELEFEILNDTDIEITAWATKAEDATLDGTDKSWFKVDDFRLYYSGINGCDLWLLLSKHLESACEYADQYINKPMNKDIHKSLKESYDKAKEIIEKKDTTADVYKLRDDIVKYVEDAIPSISVYSKVYEYYEMAMVLDESGQNKFRELAKDIIAAYQAGTITDGVEECSKLERCLRYATKAQTSDKADWTGAIYNRSFEYGMQNWNTLLGYTPFKALETNPAWEGTHKKLYAYRVNTGTSKMKCNFYQDIDTVEIGVYKLNARVYTNSNSMYIYGNDLKFKLTPSTTFAETYNEVEAFGVSWDGKRLTLGFIGDLQPGEYIRVDSITLTHVSKDMEIGCFHIPGDSVKCYRPLKVAMDEAVLAFRKEPQPEKLSDVIEAIRQVKESAKYYDTVKFYLDSVYSLMSRNNVYTREAYNLCMNLWNEVNTGYENCTLSNDDCKSVFYKFFQNGFEGFNDQTAADEDTYKTYPILNYIFDAWSLTDDMGNTVKADKNFHVNNWSKLDAAADTVGVYSEMTTPYIEYWRNGDEGPLKDATIHAKAINLKPGLYKMQVLVRVANENETVAPENFKGVTLNVTTDRVKENNGIALFESDTINVCKGEICRDNITNDKTAHYVVSQVFEVDSVIVREKDNHDANVYFNIENTNVNWLAWKDCQFVKVRDLTFEEENDTALDEDIQTLRDLIARDENKPIGFKKNEFSTYANCNIIKAHNAAKNYLETNGAIDSVINNHHLTKYQINEYINALKDESQWIIQKGDTNCIYNPYFALVKPNFYTPLYGWTITDNSVELPRTGGLNTTSATSDPTWTQFDNNRKAKNLYGEWNKFSTAATFQFENANESRSPKSVYSYGNETGFEMPLEPGQAYTLAFQYGYRSETKPGSVIIEVINKRTGEVVNRTEDRICTPQICVSDTSKIPETKQIVFNTTKREGYSNSLSNFDNLETYKVVVRNADPDNYWSMVMSNLSLYTNGTNAEEPSDTIRVDIAEAATIDTANSKKTVMVDEDGNKYYVYESLDEEKGTVVSFCIPVNEMAKGQKYYVVVVLNPLAKNRPVHLQIGLQGIPSRLIDRPSAPETDKNGVMTVLGEYVYTGEKVETLVYEYTATENIQNPMIQLSTEASSEKDYETSVALKDIYLLPTASATGIEVTRQTKVSAPEGIYTMQGVKVSSLKKGMNVVRMSDGSVKKVRL